MITKRAIFNVCLITATMGLWATGWSQQPEVIIQREDIRRQEIVLRATGELNKALDLINQGNTDEAKAIIKEIMATVPKSGKGAPLYAKAQNMLSAIEVRYGKDAARKGDWFTAKEHAIKALKIMPENQEARMLVKAADDKLGVRSDGTLNPAVDRKFITDLNQVNELFAKARDYEGTGQYDQASVSLQKIIKIDPYNKTAAKLLKKLEIKRTAAVELDRKLVREQMVTQTRENWTEQLDADLEDKATSTVVIPINRRNEFAIQEKLRKIIIPKIDFVDATVEDAVRFLTAKTRELDPDGNGVSFLIKSKEILDESRTFSLALKNIPASEALRYITNLAGVKSKVEEFAVFIVPLSSSDQVLISRDFPVRATFFDVESAEDSGGEPKSRRSRRATTRANTAQSSKDEIRSALEQRGVTFADGATAIYNNATGILSVKNTQDQIDLVEELVTENQGESLMVRVETKFIEINQSDLDELTPQFNLEGTYAVLPVNAAGINGGIAGGSVAFTNGLQGSASLRETDGVNRILNQGSASSPVNNTATANQVGITGALDGNRFATLINLISQKQSTDVMTAPSLIINDGTKGSITVAREFSFPIEYDPAETQTGTDLRIGGGLNVQGIQTVVSPAFASDFELKKIGVNMEVEPRITVDRKRVVVRLKPELVEFDGFINYGQPISDLLGTPVATNQIRIPVFTTRTVEQAEMEIQDGYTMVLGGLIREDVSTVDEKIPFLGDLPLVGRAFRSKAEQAIKKNLLIFVSVKILRPDGQPLNADTVASKY